MNYELAKQLKDAGFPQDSKNYEAYGTDGEIIKYCLECGMWTEDIDCSKPFLSELIEACGNRFDSLRKTVKWFASGYAKDSVKEVWGETAEEAVAKLWMVLHREL